MTPRSAPLRLIALPLILGLGSPLAAQSTLTPGIWTNTEDAYFAEEEGREQAEWTAFEVREDGQWRKIDAFKKPQSEWSNQPVPSLSKRGEKGWQIGQSELRLARDFRCWISVRKDSPKPDGGEDWSFQRNIDIFDQGGRILVPGNGEAPDATIRLRNVTWAKGSPNKPALVLYVHKQDPVRAVSYSWASSDAAMVGINLRWMQASCSRTQNEAKTSVEPKSSEHEPQLIAAGETWRKHYEANDWDALRTLYTDDAILMSHNQNKIEGADNIVTYLQRLSKSGAKAAIEFRPEEAKVENGLGFLIAKYQMIIVFPGAAEPTIVAGRSFLVYKWVNGEWLIWRDIDNFAPDATPKDFE
ncbi:MAG: nuclear transport factor 2 family protein [Erythrobacter sp.]